MMIWGAVAYAQVPQTSIKDEKKKDDQPKGRAIVPFLEGTDVFATAKGDTKFEADIVPHLIGKQTFGDALDYLNILGRRDDAATPGDRGGGWAISGTPAVRIRMFRDKSDPVRTPSYMPRVNIQRLWATGVKTTICRAAAMQTAPVCKGVKPHSPDAAPEIEIWELHSILGHHSNGQDGCFYANQDPKLDCAVPPGVPATPQLINRRDGSFSTNYVRVGGNYRRNRIQVEKIVENQEIHEDLLADYEWTLGAEYERNFYMDPHIVDTYGRDRFNFYAAIAGRPSGRTTRWFDQQHSYTCEARRDLKAAFKWIPGRADQSLTGDPLSKYAVTLQASCFPSSQGGWGLFVRYYQGQDYYNIGFMEDIRRVQIGVTFNQDGFFKFHLKPETKPPAK